MSVHVDIEAIDPASLTAKQSTVYKALKRGKSVVEIAEQMEITPAGVYSHLRALNRAAHQAPTTAATNGNGRTASNGTASEPGGFETAVETVQQSLVAEREIVTASQEKIAEAREAIAQAQSRIDDANHDVTQRTSRIEALESAAESLKVAV